MVLAVSIERVGVGADQHGRVGERYLHVGGAGAEHVGRARSQQIAHDYQNFNLPGYWAY